MQLAQEAAHAKMARDLSNEVCEEFHNSIKLLVTKESYINNI